MKFSGLKDVLKTFDEHGWKGVLLHGSPGQSAMEDMTAGLSFTIRVSLSQAASPGCLKVIHTQMSVKKESFFPRSSKFTLT